MFTRSSPAEPKWLAPADNGAATRGAPPPLAPRLVAAEAGPRSVTGNDLTIIGQGLKIYGQGTLQVDGEIAGDVGGAEGIFGENGNMSGTIAAERVVVRGTICGSSAAPR